MYKSLKIDNFRGFRNLVLNELGRINIIAGINNVGKTALLEAIFLHCGAYNPSLTIKIDNFRGVDTFQIEFGRPDKTPWDSLFKNFDTSKDIVIMGKFEDNSLREIRLHIIGPAEELPKEVPTFRNIPLETEKLSLSVGFDKSIGLRLDYLEENPQKNGEKIEGSTFLTIGAKGLQIQLVKPPTFPAIFLAARHRTSPTEDVERFGNLEITGQQDLLLESLTIIEPRLKRIAVVAIGGLPYLYGDIGLDQMLKLQHMGEGMAKLASLILAISSTRDGVVLIDEIENGFHHTIMPKVWLAIARAARRNNTQVFATTHSLECIIAAHKALLEEEPYDLLVHRLDCENDAVKAVTFGQEDVDIAFKMKMDIR